MVDREDLIASIYEAGALADRWPLLLDKIAEKVGAEGGTLIRSSSSGIQLVSSPRIGAIVDEFVKGGWNAQNSRVSRCLERAGHPGFMTDADLHTAEELRTLPLYAEFLTPRGADAGAGTVIQGGRDEALLVSMELFDDHAAARRAVPSLDNLRPHLARAAVLAAQLQLRLLGSATRILEAIGLGAAMLDGRGRVKAANDRFAAGFGSTMHETGKRLRLADTVADASLERALHKVRTASEGSSIAIRDAGGIGHAVLHLLPVQKDARDVFVQVGSIALLASAHNRSLPDADIIRALFDMTAAEARVARAISEGKAPAQIAAENGTATETVRHQLKQVFLKTSTRRQNELAVLLSRLSTG